jgi:hypothetical protein
MNCQDNPNCQEAADRAVKKVFAILGVDVDRPESVENFREDLRFGRKLRKAADHGFLALVGLIVVAMGAALWAGIVSKINGGH